MSLFLLFAIFLLFILLPSILLCLLLTYLSKRFNFNFKISGPLKYRDIFLVYENEYFTIILRIDLIHIYFIWLKLRFQLKGVFLNAKLNSKFLKYEKNKKRKYESSNQVFNSSIKDSINNKSFKKGLKENESR